MAHVTMNATTPSWISAGSATINGIAASSTPAAARRTTDVVHRKPLEEHMAKQIDHCAADQGR